MGKIFRDQVYSTGEDVHGFRVRKHKTGLMIINNAVSQLLERKIVFYVSTQQNKPSSQPTTMK